MNFVFPNGGCVCEQEEFSPKTDDLGPVINIVGAVAPANTSNPKPGRIMPCGSPPAFSMFQHLSASAC